MKEGRARKSQAMEKVPMENCLKVFGGMFSSDWSDAMYTIKRHNIIEISTNFILGTLSIVMWFIMSVTLGFFGFMSF